MDLKDKTPAQGGEIAGAVQMAAALEKARTEVKAQFEQEKTQMQKQHDQAVEALKVQAQKQLDEQKATFEQEKSVILAELGELKRAAVMAADKEFVAGLKQEKRIAESEFEKELNFYNSLEGDVKAAYAEILKSRPVQSSVLASTYTQATATPPGAARDVDDKWADALVSRMGQKFENTI